ncbi:hypothetical protein CP966_07745 [Streptomyces galilaeus]|nr:hypothetical protein CP966_07745 [Streptomyces galilaeus]
MVIEDTGRHRQRAHASRSTAGHTHTRVRDEAGRKASRTHGSSTPGADPRGPMPATPLSPTPTALTTGPLRHTRGERRYEARAVLDAILPV